MRRRVPKECLNISLTRFLRVFFKNLFLVFFDMSLPGVEPALSSWKVGVVTSLPPSRTNFQTNELKIRYLRLFIKFKLQLHYV